MSLLTSTFDSGPVALQHLLLLCAMALLFGFFRNPRPRLLFWGCFLLGLAMWDKALAIWMISGMGLALLVVVPNHLWRLVTTRRVGVAVLGFALGALPLIIYNVAFPLATFRGNTSWDTSDFAGKGRLLMGTADGHALFGWLNNEDWQTSQPHAPGGVVESASAKISALFRHPRQSLLLYAFIL